jgi:hypothetical protein
MSRRPGLLWCSVSVPFYNGAVLRENRTGVDQEEGASMLLRRLIALAGLALFATIAISPAGALAAAKGTDRPLKGTTTGSLTVSLPSGAATSSFTGNFSHLGATAGGDVATITLTSPTTFTYTGTDTLVAANGDEVFSTFTGSGAFTSATTIESTQVNTITGGTGRFADASGTFTVTISSVVVSSSATSDTTDNADTWNGQISY